MLFRDIEYRVITKAVAALRCAQNPALPGALEYHGCGVSGVMQVNHQALKTRAAVFIVNIFQRLQQFFQVLPVAGASAGITCRVDARCSFQCIHFQSRVICDGGQSGMLRGIACLEQRILDEGQSGLFDFFDLEFRLRYDFQLTARQQLVKFADLSGIVAGQYDALGHGMISPPGCWSAVRRVRRCLFWPALASGSFRPG